ncbi:MAG: hypothetical protein INQ03_17415 [Candidatus Heimdallarchaeota archaeon]|nr:hypothetical protein [Candidatus Heimdallarchaeota archaeon]
MVKINNLELLSKELNINLEIKEEIDWMMYIGLCIRGRYKEAGNLISYNKQNQISLYLCNIKFPKKIKSLVSMTNIKSIFIINSDLREFDNEIWLNFNNLEELYLMDNNLIEIPSSIFNLVNLKKLNIVNNKIIRIGSEIQRLKNFNAITNFSAI